MAANLAIECADRSVRWYLTPGQTSRYEILVTNQSGDESVECTMALDDPPSGGAFEPASFALRPRERKTVILTFAEETQVPRDQRVLISVRDPNSIVLASFEHGLISAGGTDCTVTLSWKEPIVDGDEIRGFVISCAIKSLSASPGTFALQFTPHPALEFVDVTPIKLQPGQTETVAIPILWKRDHKDANGFDHPHVIEISVAVSQGRRSFRLPWDTIETKLAALRPAPVPAATAAPAAPASGLDGGQIVSRDPAIASGAEHAAAAGSEHVAAAGSDYAAPPAQNAASAQESQSVAPTASPGDASSPSDSGAMDDEALMSLLVGKPVSPPPGWRSPGRDAPDAAEAPPPSIFAKTPPSVTAKPPVAPLRPPEAPVPPPPPLPAPVAPPSPPSPPPTVAPRDVVPPAARPQMPAPPPPPWIPPRDVVPPAARPQMPVRPQSSPALASGESVPPAAHPNLPPGASAYTSDVDASFAPEPAAFEAAVVGPPPTRTRTLQVEREHRESARRAAESVKAPAILEGRLPALVMGGTALIAIVLVAFLLLHPYKPTVAPQATPSPTVPPPVVLETVVPTLRTKPSVKPNSRAGASAAPSIAPSAAARVAQQATQHVVAISVPAPTMRPVPHTSAPVHRVAAHTPAPQLRRYPRPHPTSVVALAGIYARYGSSGHAVRVMWGASSQASALVQLSDDRGSVLSQTDVPGQRQNALLYVPHTYHGSVYVQVVSIGYQGEKTTQSVMLPPFSH